MGLCIRWWTAPESEGQVRMINEIIELLNNNHEVHDYEININRIKSAQLFFVLDALETNRYTDNSDITVTVYHDFEEFRGSSEFVVNSADDIDSIREKIKIAINQSLNSKNKKFNLYDNNDNYVSFDSIQNEDLNDVAIKTAKAVYKANHFENGWINSLEVFIREIETEYINSKNVHHKFLKRSGEVEVIPTFKNNEEYELYLDFKFIDEDYDYITKRTEKIFEDARNRSIAQKLELDKDVDVILNDETGFFLRNLANDISYDVVYSCMNHFKIDDVITDRNIDMIYKPYVKGVANSFPFDSNGVVLKDKKIIENGKVIDYWGSYRFGQYLKQSDISGVERVLSVDTFENEPELGENYLEIMSFSSPQFDASSGYFGGEVRLALYHHEGQIIPVTGLSISGNFYELLKDKIFFSNEKAKYIGYYGPKHMIIKGMKIN